jgi:hypothetical protein
VRDVERIVQHDQDAPLGKHGPVKPHLQIQVHRNPVPRHPERLQKDRKRLGRAQRRISGRATQIRIPLSDRVTRSQAWAP